MKEIDMNNFRNWRKYWLRRKYNTIFAFIYDYLILLFGIGVDIGIDRRKEYRRILIERFLYFKNSLFINEENIIIDKKFKEKILKKLNME